MLLSLSVITFIPKTTAHRYLAWNFWAHQGNFWNNGDPVNTEEMFQTLVCPSCQWVNVNKGDKIPETAVLAGITATDGVVYEIFLGSWSSSFRFSCQHTNLNYSSLGKSGQA